MKIKNHYLLMLVIFLGIILRVGLAPLPGFKIDIDTWFAWAQRTSLGFPNFYSDQVWTNYTPGFLYILAFLQFLKDLFHLSSSNFYLLIKLSSILAEIFLTLIIYNKIKGWASEKWALAGATLISLNPALIFNSAVWGQVDGLLTLFMVLSMMALEKGQLISSSCFFALALLIKPQALALAPIFLLFLLKYFSISNLLKITIPGILLFFFSFLPFYPANPLLGPVGLVTKMIGDYPYTSLFAYNIWGIVGFWQSDNQNFLIFSYRGLGLILYAGFWLITGYLYLKRNPNLFLLAALATLAFYFLPTRAHERYLYPAIPFLILASFSIKSKILLYLTAVLSLIYFVNMYYVYIYYNDFYLKFSNALYIDWFYNFLDKNQKGLSIFSSVIFVMISIIFLKGRNVKQRN